MNGYEQRFSGLARLYGAEGLARLQRAHVAVIGLGGVGSWVVEALARSGVGALTLMDMDDVCISNVSRQLHALDGELGKPKAEVMGRRVAAINPDCQVHVLQSFFLKSNAVKTLEAGFDAVVDAIDSPSLKALLIGMCLERKIPVVAVGGAGGRRDPTQIEVADLAFTSHDRLLLQVRRLLRRHHGFPRGEEPFGVECVLSREQAVYPTDDGRVCVTRGADPDLRLDCDSGYGTASFVTGTFGFVAASRIVQLLASSVAAPAGSEPQNTDAAGHNLILLGIGG